MPDYGYDCPECKTKLKSVNSYASKDQTFVCVNEQCDVWEVNIKWR